MIFAHVPRGRRTSQRTLHVVDIIPLEPGMAVAAQLSEADIALAAARGFRAVVAVRPDGEAPDQLLQADAAEAAEKRGLAFRYLPVSGASVIDDDTVAAFARLMERAARSCGARRRHRGSASMRFWRPRARPATRWRSCATPCRSAANGAPPRRSSRQRSSRRSKCPTSEARARMRAVSA
ncbi:MAG: sulfur transferase domain-containing protein [Pseudolabrys sp.]